MSISDYYSFVYYFTLLMSAAIFLSGLDDAFIDLVYWARSLYRRLFLLPKVHKPLQVQQMRQKEQMPIALMVPAWDESNVIATMLRTTIDFYDYDNYFIFVGAYRNDIQTINEVKRMADQYPQVQLVVVPHDGPTNKADCLNWIVQAIFLFEEDHSLHFAGIVMHDSEDVVHPLELRLYNWLLPRMGLIQIPVRTLEPHWYQLVAGTYLDEFAEWHGKDLVVRESIGGIVPSAGVATCFSREAINFLIQQNRNQPFNTATLTEDYDISFRLSGVGVKQIFVNYPVEFEFTQRKFNGELVKVKKPIPIAVSEFFPDRFWQAVRQKSRWIIGISLQGWTALAWKGSLARKYFFLRDRKGLVVNFVSLLAYLLVVLFITIWAGVAYLGWPSFDYHFPAWLLWINGLLLLNRLLQRMFFVWRLYSWRQALLVIPRVVVCNFVNFFATVRAFNRFWGSKISNKPLTWEKTDHLFPSMDQLARTPKMMGDLLLARNAISEDLLAQALVLKKTKGMALGKFLIESGCVDENVVVEAICQQTGYPRANMDTESMDLPEDFFPRDLIERFRVFPLRIDHLEKLRLAVTGALSPEALAEIKKSTDRSLAPVVVSDREMDALFRSIGLEPPEHILSWEEKLCAPREEPTDFNQ